MEVDAAIQDERAVKFLFPYRFCVCFLVAMVFFWDVQLSEYAAVVAAATATLSVPLGVFGHGSRKNPTNAKLLTISARRFKRVDVTAGVEIKILRRVRPESPRRPPRHRRDACSMAW